MYAAIVQNVIFFSRLTFCGSEIASFFHRERAAKNTFNLPGRLVGHRAT